MHIVAVHCYCVHSAQTSELHSHSTLHAMLAHSALHAHSSLPAHSTLHALLAHSALLAHMALHARSTVHALLAWLRLWV